MRSKPSPLRERVIAVDDQVRGLLVAYVAPEDLTQIVAFWTSSLLARHGSTEILEKQLVRLPGI
jgi:hypothetical protein